MSIIDRIKPEFEIVDKVETIRYLEHGWPTALCRWHAHEEYELHLVVKTSGKVFVGDYVGQFSPGSLFLTGPNLPHNWVTEESSGDVVPLRDMLINFNHNTLKKAFEAFPELAELDRLLESSRSGIEFKNYDSELAKKNLELIRDSQGMQKLMHFLNFLMELNEWPEKVTLSLTKLNPNLSSSSQHRINEVVNYVIDNYKNNISLVEAAKIVNMSESAFSRYFMKTTGNRFSEFVSRIRLGRACVMLYETDKNISTIAFASGYNNLANFNRQFVKLKGITPREYRKTAYKGLISE
ncbi:AraC family transcriptional regulator [Candidatus Thioglobus sp.]|nr:AraC family transcriptional regulator [Candidatus Thioglobus sp.]MDC1290596.1 AraC family transcriptional regulator [Candidatus Thioglobus sp.]